MDYNLSLGKGKDAQQISSNELKSGVKKEDIKDERMRSIFEALDNGNNILEESEINKLNQAIKDAAKQDGDATNLSKKEAKSLLKTLGLKGFKAEELFNFLSSVKTAGVNIDYQTRDAEKPDEIIIKYKPDAEGNTIIETHSRTDGSLVATSIQDKDNNIVNKGANNQVSSGKNDVGNYTRKYNDDGSYSDTYEDGRIRNFDKNGRWISGTNVKGITYSKEYHEDGSYTETYSNGAVAEYDKNDKQISGKLANGKTYQNEYHDDGSSTTTYSDGEVTEYDKNGKQISGKLANGTTYKNEYHEDGSYTATYSDGEVTEYDKNDKKISGKLSDGKTYQIKYHEDGSYTQTYSHGEIQEYNKDGKLISAILADGTTVEQKYHDDGSSTRTFSNGRIIEYDKNGKEISGKLANGTTYECKYDENEKLKYTEYTKKDGARYYWSADDKSYAQRTPNGNLKVSAKQGETFNDTMNRLGITDPADQEIFKKANPKAFQRGYFMLTKPGLAYGDVYIPKELADKLDMEKVLVDSGAEDKKHKEARKAKMGI